MSNRSPLVLNNGEIEQLQSSLSTENLFIGEMGTLSPTVNTGDLVHIQRTVSTGSTRALLVSSESTATETQTGSIQAVNGFCGTANTSSANFTSTNGALKNNYSVTHRGTGTVTSAFSINSGINVGYNSSNNASTITNAVEFNALSPSFVTYSSTAYGTITNFYSFKACGGTISTGGTLTNRYGLYIDDLLGGTNKWGIYQVGSADKNYFNGLTGIGTTSPTARLHLASGTATAGTAPLKIVSGTALTTPEDGALEYHSSHLYFTIGSTRYPLDCEGTVTSVSVTTANGVSGSVATNTTTPAITLTLGSITPSNVTATGIVTGVNMRVPTAQPSSLANGDIWIA